MAAPLMLDPKLYLLLRYFKIMAMAMKIYVPSRFIEKM